MHILSKKSNGPQHLTTSKNFVSELIFENCTNPDSLVVRASALGSEGCGFAPLPLPRHTKGVKNGTGSPLADAHNKRVVQGRYKNAGRPLLLVMSQ